MAETETIDPAILTIKTSLVEGINPILSKIRATAGGPEQAKFEEKKATLAENFTGATLDKMISLAMEDSGLFEKQKALDAQILQALQLAVVDLGLGKIKGKRAAGGERKSWNDATLEWVKKAVGSKATGPEIEAKAIKDGIRFSGKTNSAKSFLDNPKLFSSVKGEPVKGKKGQAPKVYSPKGK